MPYYEKRGEASWRLVVELGDKLDGSRDRRYKTVRVSDKALLKSVKKLEAYLNEELVKFKIEVEAGEYIAPEKMNFNAFVGEWRDKYAKEHLEEKTLYTYEVNLRKHIIPVFGHQRLDQIKPLHIVTFLKKLAEPGSRKDGKSLSSGTIQINHRVLKNIFKRAVEWKVIKDNPAASVQKPKVTSKQNTPYNEQEVKQLLQALQKEPIRWRVMITLAITTGLRRGELLGLEWKHVDLKTGVISVEQSVALSPKGNAHVKDPKTKGSKRKVSLPASVLEELKDYAKHQAKERDRNEIIWEGGDRKFLFCHLNGKAYHQERPYLWFRQFLKKNGFRYIRFHDLRHTSATLLINQGVHAKIISERLGHGNISTTMNVYGHALQSADQAAADKFDSLFRPQSAPNAESGTQKPL
ncbi:MULTISPECIES: site-specific integrase [unclassified Paenibacillus]|uniref:tyrosine-type recombinase/integrase n=1 Tax=unclassified Paenibacillus TaxID=185978 RepID=UPI002404A710|nr:MULTISPECIES: site-specific integrase [unclassified Paenibacillus]MDF9844591.1 integrase [Paenibacillus sp. PastF-2]MDF9851231.1 integrase [Paenibacillus sp. PastM-2]MDF9857776.1 integrase [Paenibacillus sp. PastF-1]MDH6483080.1 integrase [Paenibacillus sp. PastH-2]MDH6510456.1 integrase [Paenibacillus sp. PastM-3]